MALRNRQLRTTIRITDPDDWELVARDWADLGEPDIEETNGYDVIELSALATVRPAVGTREYRSDWLSSLDRGEW